MRIPVHVTRLSVRGREGRGVAVLRCEVLPRVLLVAVLRRDGCFRCNLRTALVVLNRVIESLNATAVSDVALRLLLLLFPIVSSV